MTNVNAQVWAVDALGALAHETRLSVFRLLVKAGPEGMIAGAAIHYVASPCHTGTGRPRPVRAREPVDPLPRRL